VKLCRFFVKLYTLKMIFVNLQASRIVASGDRSKKSELLCVIYSFPIPKDD
jgi:hypothetical protein